MIIIFTIKKPFNDYIIKGDIVVIYLPKRDGRIFECIIDLNDLEKVKSAKLHFRPSYYKKIDGYYAVATEQLGVIDGKRISRTILLHRLVANPNKGEYVDHENHDTLNNCKSNLRITTNVNNTRNKKSKNSNNTSGYRNVSYHDGTWNVQLMVNGIKTCVGRFKDVHEAGKFAEQKRNELYGEYAGCG